MARIAGVDLPRNKRIEIALTYIYGIGLSRSKEILKKTNIDADIRCQNLNDQQIVSIREILESNYQIEGDLKRFESMSIKRLMEISTYRGRRHRVGLPLRGQRTRTNARTRRGGKKTVAGKKKAPRK
ncbi:ribosomal protein S13 (chloroplast) [Porphyra umbilicalis]|uniref:Ribosomal protein S13 n=1 Tax=Porphyra umbilicalis TaxID=2786 RepID=J7F9K4_PORUM|nr:ribosomal protein S13 [Porphyra umbilicalis]AFC39964.1 ribosomal protein S13 [Porphyra umbilicalis]ASN78768.1 ribosomal protein S13 [Porphyra umbilicalis]|eukprot:ASN78768.1 ribosomal protein S13 (chloroplast) [Porphyra umbilicalis]